MESGPVIKWRKEGWFGQSVELGRHIAIFGGEYMLEEGVGRRFSMHLQGQKELPQSILQILTALLLRLRLGARSWQYEDGGTTV